MPPLAGNASPGTRPLFAQRSGSGAFATTTLSMDAWDLENDVVLLFVGVRRRSGFKQYKSPAICSLQRTSSGFNTFHIATSLGITKARRALLRRT